MNVSQIEENIKTLVDDFSKKEFVFDFLLSFGLPKATIARLKKGELNQLETKGEITLRKKLFFKEATENLHSIIDELKKSFTSQKQKPRFIIVSDYDTFLAFDTSTQDSLDIKLKDLVKHFDFFLPLAGMEKSKFVDENPADIKASIKLAKLYDEILKTNPTTNDEDIHALNVFLTRLLFCYFAEDSNIFEQNIFTNAVSNYTQSDGSDLDSFLARLFELFNTKEEDRKEDLPEFLKAFPYVNGGLFRNFFPIPRFTAKSRNLLIEIGGLDWSAINPDIFGSMIQAVVTPEHRGNMGMHYTSVPNILKVIKPLFLDELHDEFKKAKGNAKKLNQLHLRLQNIKIFDPACGSGNFLIIAYKEIRKLEMLIFKEGGLLIMPSIKLTQFYGIELDDFAHEVATLSLWLAEHQMNMVFKKEFGTVPPALPLHDGGNIVCANATRIEWESVCPKEEGDEIYVLGNPPYLGSRNQNKEQKEDMKAVFQKDYKSLDYIAAWFYKGANYIRGFNAKCAFVSTNSITQGEQVALTWPRVLRDDLEIFFAYKSFKWQNNAKANANVIVVIVGLRNKSDEPKYLYKDSIKQIVKNINPYLTNGNVVYIQKRKQTISKIPLMSYGNMPLEGGFLRFNDVEKEILGKNDNRISKYIRKVIGGEEFLKGINRYCLWIENEELEEALKILDISKRIEQVKNFRINGGEVAKTLVERSHQFRYRNEPKNTQVVVPCTSSENRNYLPCAFYDKSYVSLNSVQVIYDAEPWIFGVISSKMHMVWVRAVAGRLKTDFRYSSALVYNTFPFPDITRKQKDEITELVFDILDERERHSEKTLAQLYDPDKMPQDLKEAHHRLDLAIERCYRKKPFESDEERLEYLFRLYEEMVEKENITK